MEKLPHELAYIIGERLPRRDLARLSRASRAINQQMEAVLYRLYALPEIANRLVRSAVVYAVEIAHPDKPDTQATALATLGKVARFCHVHPATLDRHRRFTFIPAWINYDNESQLIAPYPSLTPLHVAALKGLDDIVVWLLDKGASIDTPALGMHITALYLAVLANRISTVMLLLANHADPNISVGMNDVFACKPSTIFHLVCAMGRAELCERLMASIPYMETDSAELLSFYGRQCKTDVPKVVSVLVRRGEEHVSDDWDDWDAVMGIFLRKGKLRSAAELLATPAFDENLTVYRANSLLRAILGCGVHLLAEHSEVFQRMLRLLVDRGADVNLARHVWSKMDSLGYSAMLQVMRPLLEAGLVVGPSLRVNPKKRKRGGKSPQTTCEMDDILGVTSAYNEYQDEEGAEAQLAIIRLLLQHGAPIEGASRGDALDAYPRDPEDCSGRGRWACRLCHVLVDHCHSVPEDQRGKDIDAFLRRYSDIKILRGGG